MRLPYIYDTYDDLSMGRMKFEKALDGSWVRRARRPPTQARDRERHRLGDRERHIPE